MLRTICLIIDVILIFWNVAGAIFCSYPMGFLNIGAVMFLLWVIWFCWFSPTKKRFDRHIQADRYTWPPVKDRN
jgi:hypothetical protein